MALRMTQPWNARVNAPPKTELIPMPAHGPSTRNMWARPSQHLSFGFGIHRCVGNRLAELQLKSLWEAFLKRFTATEVMAEPLRMRNNFVRGVSELLVRVPR